MSASAVFSDKNIAKLNYSNSIIKRLAFTISVKHYFVTLCAIYRKKLSLQKNATAPKYARSGSVIQTQTFAVDIRSPACACHKSQYDGQ